MLRSHAHRVAAAEEVVHDFERLGDAVVAGAEDFGVFLRGFQVPRPCILERLDLRVRLRAVLLGEEDVVILVTLKRRV